MTPLEELLQAGKATFTSREALARVVRESSMNIGLAEDIIAVCNSWLSPERFGIGDRRSVIRFELVQKVTPSLTFFNMDLYNANGNKLVGCLQFFVNKAGLIREMRDISEHVLGSQVSRFYISGTNDYCQSYSY